MREDYRREDDAALRMEADKLSAAASQARKLAHDNSYASLLSEHGVRLLRRRLAVTRENLERVIDSMSKASK